MDAIFSLIQGNKKLTILDKCIIVFTLSIYFLARLPIDNNIKYGFYIMLFLIAAIYIVINKMPMKSRIFFAFAYIIGVLSILYSNDVKVLRLICVGIILSKYNINSIFKYAFYTFLYIFIIFAIFSLFGFNSEYNLVSSASRRTRYALGFTHPNQAMFTLMLTIFFYYCYKRKITLLSVVISIVSLCIVFYLTDSRAAFIITVAFLLSAFLLQYFKVPKAILYILSSFQIIFLILSFLACSIYYSESLNTLLSGRVYYGQYMIYNFPVQLFSTYSLPKNIILDNAYIYAIYQLGLIPSLFIFISYTYSQYYIINNYQKKDAVIFTLIFFFICVYGLAETGMYNNIIPQIIIFFHALTKSKSARKLEYTLKLRI